MTEWTMTQAQRDFKSGAIDRCSIQFCTSVPMNPAYTISFESAFGSEGPLVDGRIICRPLRRFASLAEAQAVVRKIGFESKERVVSAELRHYDRTAVRPQRRRHSPPKRRRP